MTTPAAKYSIGIRLFLIALLSIVLLIPLFMIQSLIGEREFRRNEAVHEVSSKWGKAQTIAGPILTVPFKTRAVDAKGNATTVIYYAHFLPDDLSISGEIQPEVRYRGIYKAVLYNAKLSFSGTFLASNIKDFSIPEAEMVWDNAFIAIGITDMKGIKDTIRIKWNERDLPFNPGIASHDVQLSGISARAAFDTKIDKYSFSMNINFNGSEELAFIPIGKETRTKISAAWGNPSFVGEFLPEAREIQEDGFSAEWKVLHLNRNYPQRWTGNSYKIEPSAFGVRFILPVDEYQKINRTAKYAVMFISLTFLSFFMIEVLNKKVMHPIQYLLIGFALLLFYTLLLSVSEHVGFQPSYVIASVAMTALIAGYTKAVLSNKLLATVIAGILVTLYGYLYVILQLQDYALLMGSVGLFVILALVMYLTRRIDWSAIWKSSAEQV
jgi:inner membrane protein